MKKIIVPLLICTILFSFAACSNSTKQTNDNTFPVMTTDDEGSDDRVINPWKDFDQFTDAKTDSGVNFMLPDEIKSDVKVYRSLSGKMLEIKFTSSGTGATLRVAKATTEDISGDYNKYAYEAAIRCRGLDINICSSDSSKLQKATWTDGMLSYVLIYDSEVPFDEANSLISTIILENTEAY